MIEDSFLWLIEMVDWFKSSRGKGLILLKNFVFPAGAEALPRSVVKSFLFLSPAGFSVFPGQAAPDGCDNAANGAFGFNCLSAETSAKIDLNPFTTHLAPSMNP